MCVPTTLSAYLGTATTRSAQINQFCFPLGSGSSLPVHSFSFSALASMCIARFIKVGRYLRAQNGSMMGTRTTQVIINTVLETSWPKMLLGVSCSRKRGGTITRDSRTSTMPPLLLNTQTSKMIPTPKGPDLINLTASSRASRTTGRPSCSETGRPGDRRMICSSTSQITGRSQ